MGSRMLMPLPSPSTLRQHSTWPLLIVALVLAALGPQLARSTSACGWHCEGFCAPGSDPDVCLPVSCLPSDPAACPGSRCIAAETSAVDGAGCDDGFGDEGGAGGAGNGTESASEEESPGSPLGVPFEYVLIAAGSALALVLCLVIVAWYWWCGCRCCCCGRRSKSGRSGDRRADQGGGEAAEEAADPFAGFAGGLDEVRKRKLEELVQRQASSRSRGAATPKAAGADASGAANKAYGDRSPFHNWDDWFADDPESGAEPRVQDASPFATSAAVSASPLAGGQGGGSTTWRSGRSPSSVPQRGASGQALSDFAMGSSSPGGGEGSPTRRELESSPMSAESERLAERLRELEEKLAAKEEEADRIADALEAAEAAREHDVRAAVRAKVAAAKAAKVAVTTAAKEVREAREAAARAEWLARHGAAGAAGAGAAEDLGAAGAAGAGGAGAGVGARRGGAGEAGGRGVLDMMSAPGAAAPEPQPTSGAEAAAAPAEVGVEPVAVSQGGGRSAWWRSLPFLRGSLAASAEAPSPSSSPAKGTSSPRAGPSAPTSPSAGVGGPASGAGAGEAAVVGFFARALRGGEEEGGADAAAAAAGAEEAAAATSADLVEAADAQDPTCDGAGATDKGQEETSPSSRRSQSPGAAVIGGADGQQVEAEEETEQAADGEASGQDASADREERRRQRKKEKKRKRRKDAASEEAVAEGADEPSAQERLHEEEEDLEAGGGVPTADERRHDPPLGAAGGPLGGAGGLGGAGLGGEEGALGKRRHLGLRSWASRLLPFSRGGAEPSPPDLGFGGGKSSSSRPPSAAGRGFDEEDLERGQSQAFEAQQARLLALVGSLSNRLADLELRGASGGGGEGAGIGGGGASSARGARSAREQAAELVDDAAAAAELADSSRRAAEAAAAARGSAGEPGVAAAARAAAATDEAIADLAKRLMELGRGFAADRPANPGAGAAGASAGASAAASARDRPSARPSARGAAAAASAAGAARGAASAAAAAATRAWARGRRRSGGNRPSSASAEEDELGGDAVAAAAAAEDDDTGAGQDTEPEAACGSKASATSARGLKKAGEECSGLDECRLALALVAAEPAPEPAFGEDQASGCPASPLKLFDAAPDAGDAAASIVRSAGSGCAGLESPSLRPLVLPLEPLKASSINTDAAESRQGGRSSLRFDGNGVAAHDGAPFAFAPTSVAEAEGCSPLADRSGSPGCGGVDGSWDGRGWEAGGLGGGASCNGRSPPRRRTPQEWEAPGFGTLTVDESCENTPRAVTSVDKQKWLDPAAGTMSLQSGRERAPWTAHGRWEPAADLVYKGRAGLQGVKALGSKWEDPALGTVLAPHLRERPRERTGFNPHVRWEASPAFIASSAVGIPKTCAGGVAGGPGGSRQALPVSRV